MAKSQLFKSLQDALISHADPVRAPQMQRYMKSEMPFYGVPAPMVKRICREIFSLHVPVNAENWRNEALFIWRNAHYREERYAAIEYTKNRQAKAFQDLKAMPVYEEFIVTGAWWDLVDIVASHQIGDLLQAHPVVVRKKMLTWSRSPDLWKRRSSIICQLRFKAETDLSLLYSCIEQSMDSKEFFLRKAIGWALRQYAREDGPEVVRYIHQHKDQLSPLSKKEALKQLLRAAGPREQKELLKLV